LVGREKRRELFEVDIIVEKSPHDVKFGSTAAGHIIVDRRSVIGLLLTRE